MKTLSQLKAGCSAKIIGFAAGDKNYRAKLLSMGLIPNAVVQLLRVSPFKGAMEIKVQGYCNSCGYCLSLRAKECQILQVEPI